MQFLKCAGFPPSSDVLGHRSSLGLRVESHRRKGESLASKVRRCADRFWEACANVLILEAFCILVSVITIPLKWFHQRFRSGFHSVNPIVLGPCVWTSGESQPGFESVVLVPSPACFLCEMILRNIVKKNEFEINSWELLDWDFSSIIYINCSLALCSAICYLLEGM